MLLIVLNAKIRGLNENKKYPPPRAGQAVFDRA